MTLEKLVEDTHAIRQNIERLVHHLTGVERGGEISNRDRQRTPFVSRKKQWCLRQKSWPYQIWAPFETKDRAWHFLHDKIRFSTKIDKKCLRIKGSYEEDYATFEEIGTYFIEPFNQVEKES